MLSLLGAFGLSISLESNFSASIFVFLLPAMIPLAILVFITFAWGYKLREVCSGDRCFGKDIQNHTP
jgi:hypothetical protein